jgi:hypothetical protein
MDHVCVYRAVNQWRARTYACPDRYLLATMAPLCVHCRTCMHVLEVRMHATRGVDPFATRTRAYVSPLEWGGPARPHGRLRRVSVAVGARGLALTALYVPCLHQSGSIRIWQCHAGGAAATALAKASKEKPRGCWASRSQCEYDTGGVSVVKCLAFAGKRRELGTGGHMRGLRDTAITWPGRGVLEGASCVRDARACRQAPRASRVLACSLSVHRLPTALEEEAEGNVEKNGRRATWLP